MHPNSPQSPNITHAKKSLLYHQKSPWVKKDTDSMFNVTMRLYEGAETCEVIGTYMLSLITANFKDQVEPDSTVTTGLPREIEKIKQQVSNHVFKCEIARLLKYYMKAIGQTFHGLIGV